MSNLNMQLKALYIIIYILYSDVNIKQSKLIFLASCPFLNIFFNYLSISVGCHYKYHTYYIIII